MDKINMGEKMREIIESILIKLGILANEEYNKKIDEMELSNLSFLWKG